MILRRVIHHFRNQEWTAIALDFLIVVVGVFIGIQVSNWNTNRQEDTQRNLIHTRLVNDFTIMRDGLMEGLAAHEHVIESLHVLRGAIERGAAHSEEDEDIKTALNYGFSYQDPNYRSGTFIELLSSGRLDLIAGEDLRVTLISYDDRAQRTLFNLNQIRNYINTRMPDLHRYKDLAPLTRDKDGLIMLSPVVRYDIAGMAADERFRNNLDQLVELQTWAQVNSNEQAQGAEYVLETLKETDE